MGHIVNKDGRWWIGAENKGIWFLQEKDNWYIFRNGKQLSPKDTKKSPMSQNTHRKRYSNDNWIYHTAWILAGLLGISLALILGLLLNL